MPKPVAKSTEAAPKSGSPSSSAAMSARSPSGFSSPVKLSRSSSCRRTA